MPGIGKFIRQEIGENITSVGDRNFGLGEKKGKVIAALSEVILKSKEIEVNDKVEHIPDRIILKFLIIDSESVEVIVDGDMATVTNYVIGATHPHWVNLESDEKYMDSTVAAYTGLVAAFEGGETVLNDSHLKYQEYFESKIGHLFHIDMTSRRDKATKEKYWVNFKLLGSLKSRNLTDLLSDIGVATFKQTKELTMFLNGLGSPTTKVTATEDDAP